MSTQPLFWESFKRVAKEVGVDPYARDEFEVEYPTNSGNVTIYRCVEPHKKQAEIDMLKGVKGYVR